MFMKNKYTKWYYHIINGAVNRRLEIYTEEHHVIPKSMGGTNHSDNLVRLTAREHFLCHLLLTKMVNGQFKHKAIKAARMMAKITGPKQQRYKVTARIYESLIRNKIEVSAETKSKMGISQKQRFAHTPGTFLDKKHSEETLEKLRRPKTEEQKQKQSQSMKGRFKGRIPHNKGKTFEELYGDRAEEIRDKVRRVGEKNGFYGKTHTEEQRQKKRLEKLNSTKQQCLYCDKLVDPMNYARWHGDKCKNK